MTFGDKSKAQSASSHIQDVAGHHLLINTHLMDQCGDIYGFSFLAQGHFKKQTAPSAPQSSFIRVIDLIVAFKVTPCFILTNVQHYEIVYLHNQQIKKKYDKDYYFFVLDKHARILWIKDCESCQTLQI